MSGLTLDVPPELLERIAQRAAELVAERHLAAAPAEGWLRGAAEIADYTGMTRSRVYSLVSARRIPVGHDGAALVARRSALDRWIDSGGATCP